MEVNFSPFSTVDPRHFDELISQWDVERASLQSELRKLQKRNKELLMKVKSLQKNLRKVKNANLLPEESSKMARELFENERKNAEKPERARRYTSEIKQFAIESSYYSNSG